MKNLKNVKGAKMLTRNDQKSIIGGLQHGYRIKDAGQINAV